MLKFRTQHGPLDLNTEGLPLKQALSIQEAVWNNLQIYQGQQTLFEHLIQATAGAVPASETWQDLESWQAQLQGLLQQLETRFEVLEALDLERYGFTAQEVFDVLQDMLILCQAARQAGASEVRMDLNDEGDLDSEI